MNEESTEMWYKGGRSDKVYSVSLLNSSGNNWDVRFAYGRRGAAPQTGYKTQNSTYHRAKEIYDEVVSEKTQSGYQITSGGSMSNMLTSIPSKKSIGYIPQLLNPIEETDIQFYLDNDGWCMQEKFDGRNRLLLKDGKKAIGGNRKGLEVDITAEVKKELLSLPDCVLAGEDMGSYVVVFDAIHLKGGYNTRIAAVNQLLKGCTKLVPAHTAYDKKDKVLWLRKFKAGKSEGVVFKQLDAYYTPGRPASGGSQVKFKFTATASVIAGDQNKGKRSVEMWVYDGALRVNVGSVTIYPNQTIPKRGEILEVKYLYYFPGGSLFQPVYLNSRDDLNDMECALEKLKCKKEEE
jgi:bifunctional non-homologous end joining protein LigD